MSSAAATKSTGWVVPWSGLRRMGVALGAIAVVGFGIAVLGLSRANNLNGGDEQDFAGLALFTGFLSLPLVGAGLLWVMPRQPIGRLLLAMGLVALLSQLASVWAFFDLRTHPGSLFGGEIAAWLASWLLVPAFGLGPFIIAAFPDGRIRSPWLQRVRSPAIAAVIAIGLAQSVAPDILDGGPPGVPPIRNPLGVDSARGVVRVVTTAGVLIVVAFGVFAVVDLVRRYRRACGEERQQLRWVAAATALLPVGFAVSTTLTALGYQAVGLIFLGFCQIGMLFGLAAAIAIAVLRYRLYNLDLVVNKSLLYAALTVFVAASYAGTVGILALAFNQRSGPFPSLVATGGVALAFQPVRRRLQVAADRLVYGGRAEPYAALSRLGARLETTIQPADVPAVLADAVAGELQFPYVGVEIDRHIALEIGVPTDHLDQIPLVHADECLGNLLLGRRRGRPLTPVEERLLRDLARQAGVALHAARLSHEVQQARERLVTSREEERRRIRRDLHDGVGPALAGLALQAGALRQQAGDDRTSAALERFQRGLEAALGEVRRAVHGLRPPALDELGLLGSLRELSAGFNTSELSVTVQLPGELPPLPAAVEVATLRSAAEALTNASRHAHATRCELRLVCRQECLELSITDNGVGLREPYVPGVGLRSLRERAQEIGGVCVVTAAAGGGTVVLSTLPMRG